MKHLFIIMGLLVSISTYANESHTCSPMEMNRSLKEKGFNNSDIRVIGKILRTECSSDTSEHVVKGTVIHIERQTGFGVILGQDRELYRFHSGLIDEIREDDEVEFELKEGRKGMNAIDVKRLD